MFKKLISDPLIHFLLFGFLLFTFSQYFLANESSVSSSSRIIVTDNKQSQLVAMFESSWQRKPTENEVKGLIEGYILEEIYYREALNLGLDKNDTVIRQRLKQKLEFLQEDISNYEPPSDEELNVWYLNNQKYFIAPARYSFRQVLLKPEDVQRIVTLQIALNDELITPSELSASGLLELKSTGLTEQAIVNRFGEIFTMELKQLKPSREWQGPVNSAFGTHLVQLSEIQSPQTPDISDIRDRVVQEYQSARRKDYKLEIQQRLKDSYSIEVE